MLRRDSLHQHALLLTSIDASETNHEDLPDRRPLRSCRLGNGLRALTARLVMNETDRE
jgi:hypothetical protein